MNAESLEAKKAELQDKFNTISKQVNDLNIELRRLEGAYSILNTLQEELKVSTVETKANEVKHGRSTAK